MADKPLYPGRCVECGRAKSGTYDPHHRCWQCKSACSLDDRCEECEHLSTHAFKRFLACLRKGKRQAARRQSKRSSKMDAPAEDEEEDDDSLVLRETGSEFDDELADDNPPEEAVPIEDPEPRERTGRRDRGRKRRRSRSRSRSRSRHDDDMDKKFSRWSKDMEGTMGVMIKSSVDAMERRLMAHFGGSTQKSATASTVQATPDRDATQDDQGAGSPTPDRDSALPSGDSRSVDFVNVDNPPIIPILTDQDGDDELGEEEPVMDDALDAIAYYAKVPLGTVQRTASATHQAANESFAVAPPRLSPRKVLPTHRLVRAAIDDYTDTVANAEPPRGLLPKRVVTDKAVLEQPIQCPDFSLLAPTVEKDVQQLTDHYKTPHRTSDNQLLHLDSEARSIMTVGNLAATTCQAMAQYATEAGMKQGDPYLYDAFSQVAGSLALMLLSAGRIAAATVNLRREGFLANSKLPQDLRQQLRAAPANTTNLFGGQIPGVLKQHQERLQRELTRKALSERAPPAPRSRSRDREQQAQLPSRPRPKVSFRGRGRGRGSTGREGGYSSDARSPKRGQSPGKGRGKSILRKS